MWVQKLQKYPKASDYTRLKVLQHDTREDATGMDAQATGRKELFAVLIGTDVAEADMVGGYAAGHQLLTVAFGQVDVPLGSEK